MTMKIDLPPVPFQVKLGTVGPLNVIRDPMTNTRFLTTATVEDEDWEDDESEGVGHPLKLVIISSSDPDEGIGEIVSRSPDTRFILELAELKVIKHEDHDGLLLINNLTRAEYDLLEAGSKIEAIKLVRNRTGLGLKAAKDMVDNAIQSFLAPRDTH